MAKNILFKILFCFFSSQIFLFDLNPYENIYSSKPTGSVKETLEKISENNWKISCWLVVIKGWIFTRHSV